MSDVAERYRRLSGDFAATVAAVGDDGWDQTTPCPQWTARDLVGHVVDSQGMFLGFVGGSLPEGPGVVADPVAAWDRARGAVQAELDDPERAAAEFEGFTGPSTLAAAVDRFLCTDLVIHRWDLAMATGQDVSLDPAEMAHVRNAMAPMADQLRGPGAFGPELELPPAADEQTTFLAYFGRQR